MIKRVVVRNYKAIRDSGDIFLKPFNVFIGNNGTGKSSVMEALRALQMCVCGNITDAFKDFGGLQKVHNYSGQGQEINLTPEGFQKKNEGIHFKLECQINGSEYFYALKLNTDVAENIYVVEHELLRKNGSNVIEGKAIDNFGNRLVDIYSATQSAISKQYRYSGDTLLARINSSNIQYVDNATAELRNHMMSWQFLHLNAHDMGKPVFKGMKLQTELDYDGRNIADYILWLRNQSQDYLNALINKLQFILPYLQNIQPNITGTINSEVELLMHENGFDKTVPGWLLSSGTLRIAALLSMFDNPSPPSVLFIDEIENGLDPRTIGFLIEEIRNAVQSEKPMQVICTTHSPYLLDLIPLESVIVTERGESGSTFRFPANEKELDGWKEKFSPGKLYTIGKLNKD
ncbi:MAG TPA: AAA family ATPase [Bacteroidia bacterium]|nr:AAA family ATPase [Bacteroidia bacterium]HNU33636.1 AAA family ATPase [Bacteroidia bacterium]